MTVEESRRMATLPARPPWRSSDPRWRRRMLAGTWILTLQPLVDVMRAAGWSAVIPMRIPFDHLGAVVTLDDTLLFTPWIYLPVMFCIGVVLLFSKERGRRRNRLDWTRRWGVICSYETFLLAASLLLYISAIVMIGLASLFFSMQPRYQPWFARLFVEAGGFYLRHGPEPTVAASIVQAASSSVAMLLACAPLFEALRCSGPRRLAAALVSPIAISAAGQLTLIALYYAGVADVSHRVVTRYGTFFCPELFASPMGTPVGGIGPPSSGIALAIESAKCFAILAIAIWLSVAAAINVSRRDKG